MTRWMNFLATLGGIIIVVVLGYAILTEEARQAQAREDLQAESLKIATDLYATNCVACHGADGEGILTNPPLNSAALQAMPAETLFKTIARGRYNTIMAAWAVEEGGVLSNAQIQQLVTLITTPIWASVSQRVADLGLTPPEPIVIEIDEATLTLIQQLPNGQALAAGVALYSENCLTCHATSLAPSLVTPELRSRLTDADLARIITEGVAGTLMSGWANTLNAEEVSQLVAFLRNYETLATAGVTIPNAPAPVVLDITPELIAEGARFYNLLCVQCHGQNGYGTTLAPALNAQPFLGNTPDGAIMQIISAGVPSTVMPAWGGYLTEANIQALAAYLRSWEPTAPTVVR